MFRWRGSHHPTMSCHFRLQSFRFRHKHLWSVLVVVVFLWVFVVFFLYNLKSSNVRKLHFVYWVFRGEFRVPKVDSMAIFVVMNHSNDYKDKMIGFTTKFHIAFWLALGGLQSGQTGNIKLVVSKFSHSKVVANVHHHHY